MRFSRPSALPLNELTKPSQDMSEYILDHPDLDEDEGEDGDMFSDSDSDWLDDSENQEELGFSLAMLSQDKSLFDRLPQGPEIDGLIKLPVPVPQLQASASACASCETFASRKARRLVVNNGRIVKHKASTFDLLFGDKKQKYLEAELCRNQHEQDEHDDAHAAAGAISKSTSSQRDDEKVSTTATAVYKLREDGKRSYFCTECSYTKATKAAVINHIGQVHGGYVPECCPHCPFTSRNPDVFRQHVRMCRKPLQCPHCDYSSTKSYTLKVHIGRKHKPTPIPTPK